MDNTQRPPCLSSARPHVFGAFALYALASATVRLADGAYNVAPFVVYFLAGFLSVLSLLWGSFGAFLLVRQKQVPSAAALLGVLVSWNISRCSYYFYYVEEMFGEGGDIVMVLPSYNDYGYHQRDAHGKYRATIAFAALFGFLGASCLLGAGLLAAQAKDMGSVGFYGGFGVLELARAIATTGPLSMRKASQNAILALSMLCAMVAVAGLGFGAFRCMRDKGSKVRAMLMAAVATLAAQLFVLDAHGLAKTNKEQLSEGSQKGAFAIAGIFVLFGMLLCFAAAGLAMIRTSRDVPLACFSAGAALSCFLASATLYFGTAQSIGESSWDDPDNAHNDAFLTFLALGIFELLGSFAAMAAAGLSMVPQFAPADADEPMLVPSGGDFDEHTGQPIRNVARFDPTTGQPLGGEQAYAPPTQTPNPQSNVSAVSDVGSEAPLSRVDMETHASSITLIAAHARGKDSGAGLVDKRIDVFGKGKGTVVDIKKSTGRATKHVVLFDSGARETLRLSKDPNNPKATAKGLKFYMI
eukprot:g3418.t1